VQSGDSLNSIVGRAAAEHGLSTTVADVVAANHLAGARLKVGQKILVPAEPVSSAEPTPKDPSLPGGAPSGEDLPTGDVQAGYVYILHRGDSLEDVVAVVLKDHDVQTTVDDLLAANTTLITGKLRPGQKVFVPAP
jgi:LysM repeat protein